jgi:hypothetical protein
MAGPYVPVAPYFVMIPAGIDHLPGLSFLRTHQRDRTDIGRSANMTNMANRAGRRADAIPRANVFAHIIERIGLAVLGALCGLFVSALIASANIQAINSVGALFATMLYGTIGFYLGIDFPLPLTRVIEIAGNKNNVHPDAAPLKLISAIGTLLAAMAAMTSVCFIIFDSVPYNFCLATIGGAWLVGVTMQIAAGSMARVLGAAGASSTLSGRKPLS